MGGILNKFTDKNRLDLFLSAHRAVLGIVTPNIRSIYIRDTEDNEGLIDIALVAYFTSDPTENERELFSIAMAEIISDIPPDLLPGLTCDEELIVLEPPQQWTCKESEMPIYIRYEPSTYA